jgi:hypothetical protein
MEHTDLQAGLLRLTESLGRMQSLLAWHRLKQHEARPGWPPSFAMYDPTETDLSNEYSFFLSTSIRMHSALNQLDRRFPKSLHEQIKKELAGLEHQVRALNLERRQLED